MDSDSRSDLKTIPLVVVLSVASNQGLGVKFELLREAIAHVLGWEIAIHELAEVGPWARARELIVAARPHLTPFVDRLHRDGQSKEQLIATVAEAAMLFGEDIRLPRGSDKRAEPLAVSLLRVLEQVSHPSIIIAQMDTTGFETMTPDQLADKHVKYTIADPALHTAIATCPCPCAIAYREAKGNYE